MWAPYTMAGTGLLLALYQVATPGGELGALFGQFEHVGLVGVLGVSLLFVWKAFLKKDADLIAATKETQAALTSAAELSKMVITTNEKNTEALAKLHDAIQSLQVQIGRLPCTETHQGVK